MLLALSIIVNMSSHLSFLRTYVTLSVIASIFYKSNSSPDIPKPYNLYYKTLCFKRISPFSKDVTRAVSHVNSS